jgi:dihydrodipicolinate synthase/N-acetylneuraminate lyase
LAAAITPREESTLAVDTGAAADLVQFLEAHGVDGLTLFGSTGEFVHFDPAERARLVAAVKKSTRLPLLVNASHSTLDGSVRIAREAADRGAAGVMILPPYYFRYSQESIKAFCLEFASQVAVPVFLYNIPFFTNPMELESALALLRTGAFAGIKDSGGQWDYFVALDQAAKERDLAVLVGNDAMYGWAAKAGAAGTVSGVATALPELMVAVDRIARSGGDTSALDALVKEFIDRVLAFPLPIAIREAVAVRGIRTGPHASPLGAQGALALDEFRAWFRDWLPAMQAAARSLQFQAELPQEIGPAHV